ncbi:hypothetical protein HK097_000421 [Rhizophlyctis rosea]|uniref:Integrase n=1 Tax=Rhizophlyctis rosea TaxID=64517 RepID=A0AAD5SGK2_9FUNG|nr:hypothetical protein HK097_000421 [Rhizophlyctis rosea]
MVVRKKKFVRTVKMPSQLKAYWNKEKKNQDIYKPLSREEEEKLRDIYYNAPLGRDDVYDLFKRKHPEEKASRRAIWSWMAKQEIHQIQQRPTISRGVVRPILAKSLGNVQIDYVDMSSSVFNGFNCALVGVNVFSKKIHVYPAKEQTVENTKKGIEKWIRDDDMKISFCQSDNRTSFKGDFPQWLRAKGIKHGYSKEYSSMSNDTTDWLSLTQQVVEQLNETMTFSTKKSANDIESDPALHEEVATRLQNVASKRHDYDSSGLIRYARIGYWSKEIYVIHIVIQNRKNPHISSSYKIKNVETNEIAKGLIPRGALLQIPDPANLDRVPQQEVRPGPVDEEGRYEVENIVGKKVGRPTRGRSGIMYCVRWKGYKKLYWEPLENLDNAQDLIKEFEAAHG